MAYNPVGILLRLFTGNPKESFGISTISPGLRLFTSIPNICWVLGNGDIWNLGSFSGSLDNMIRSRPLIDSLYISFEKDTVIFVNYFTQILGLYVLFIISEVN